MRKAKVRGKEVLVICAMLLTIFSTDVVMADYIQDAQDICWKVSQTLDVGGIVRGYKEGYVTKEKILELLKEARDFAFEKLRDWQILHRQRAMIELDPFDQAVLNFFGMKIGLISYTLYMIEQEKIGPGVASSYESLIISGLSAVTAGAMVEVNDEADRLRR